MAKKHLIGIHRSQQFSPNRSDDDAAIFQAVVAELEQMKCCVDSMSEEEFVARYTQHLDQLRADAIFGMYRNLDTLHLLDDCDMLYQIPAINPSWGVLNAIRKNQTLLLQAHDIPMPQTQIVDTSFLFDDSMSYPCWLKRGDSCSQIREDVVYAANKEQAQVALQAFQRRGLVRDIVISEHLEGDLIKFYGVEGINFFDWDYASNLCSKFGLELYNGKAQGFPFSADALKRLADTVANILDIPIYGGDCIVSASGDIRIIDFNDWPSFARCRDAAAHAIAQRILK